MLHNDVISSFEIKTSPGISPTCVVNLVRGSQFSFRLCNGELRKVAWQGHATKEEFLAACSLAGTKIREVMQGPSAQKPVSRYSEAAAWAHALRIDPHQPEY